MKRVKKEKDLLSEIFCYVTDVWYSYIFVDQVPGVDWFEKYKDTREKQEQTSTYT